MSKTFIIAEAGVNHNGNLVLAKKMIDVAAKAGVDAVKFQTFKADKLVCMDAQKAIYQQKNAVNRQESQYEMLKKLELSGQMHRELIDYCVQKDIMFLSTPFDTDSVRMLVDYGITILKISSGEITNYPLLREVGRTGKPVILSTGMSDMDEVQAAVAVLTENGSGKITLLHCNTEYPTPMQDVNLRAMCTLQEKTGLPVGYSDHTLGIEVPIAAAAMGAVVIEKHFTLDRTMEGPDHKASLEPDELKEMVKAIRNIELSLGDGRKLPSDSEKQNINIVRKSIVAKRDIVQGEILTEENLTTKRPGNGVSPMKWQEVLGTKAVHDFKMDEQIEL